MKKTNLWLQRKEKTVKAASALGYKNAGRVRLGLHFSAPKSTRAWGKKQAGTERTCVENSLRPRLKGTEL